MPAPIALQLYTLRDALKNDFASTVRRVAEMGYAGVEPFGIPGTSPRDAKALFDDLGLDVSSAHLPIPLGEQQGKTLEAAHVLDCPRIVSGFGPQDFSTLDGVMRCCDKFNEAQQVAAENGLSFGIHNHWWEYVEVEGKLPYQIMLERLDPGIFFEVDIYWVKTAGVDPKAALAQMGERAPLLHIKDGPAVKGQPMTAVGKGSLDIPGIIRAHEAHTDWLIVELDECATDMMDAVEDSYSYLAGEGLGRGRH